MFDVNGEDIPSIENFRRFLVDLAIDEENVGAFAGVPSNGAIMLLPIGVRVIFRVW